MITKLTKMEIIDLAHALDVLLIDYYEPRFNKYKALRRKLTKIRTELAK